MYRAVGGFLLLVPMGLAAAMQGTGQDPPKKDPAKKPPAVLTELAKLDVAGFLRGFDKNKDGFVTKEELPPLLAERFEKLDTSGDGKLDRTEIEQLLQFARRQVGGSPPKPEKPAGKPVDPQKLVADWLTRLDKNKDGKLSKEEAEGPLAQAFDRIDTDKSGFLERNELRLMAERLAQMGAALGKGDPRTGGSPRRPEFDPLDKNADGRLTREEVRGSPLEAQFEAIDTNKDGQIDRREFEAFLRKQEERKSP